MNYKNIILIISVCFMLISCKKENFNEIKNKELTIHFHFYNSRVWDENWPVAKKLTELTGIKLKNVAPKNARNSMETINLLFSSEDLPDIIAGQNIKEIFNKYGMLGKIIPLNDLIEKYAPNIKKVLEENPEIRRSILAPDGNIYYIPYITDGIVGRGWVIRQDWLDKLGLKQPTTINELYKVMIAFRDKDPNGNGLKDEIPFFTREVQGWEVLRLGNLFGARVSGSDRELGDFYIENNKVKHGFVQPEFKNAIKNISKWYSEKLIDPEIFTRGINSREILFTLNQGGITRDWFASTLGMNKIMKKENPEFNLTIMYPPKDINGNCWEESRRRKIRPDGWAISFKNKNPIETIKYFDFIYGDEGKRLINFGLEGEEYEIIDGKIKFLPIVFNSELAPLEYLKTIGAQVPIGCLQDYNAELLTLSENEINQIQKYSDYVIEEFPEVNMTLEEKKIFDKKWPVIYLYMKERIQKWILGIEPLTEENWESYLYNIKKLGLDEIIKITENALIRENKIEKK